MLKSKEKSAPRKPTSINLTEDERSMLEDLSREKYAGALGFTQVLRVEGLPKVKAELERIRGEREAAES